ncbi:DgyrCDS11600 [Dimorphilus gyrociliatus]|uniref:DgyrCDS11600 n=1 Tax=Dimorphilus gyrociliatus TaxID=2664684 RepID=A0A7I8W3V7_9ANNE|nr:DgyrCDS11600 [Dimorphilus gyrociliatus]
MSWANELPEELLIRPVGLVILANLDIANNSIHKSIWESFSSNRRPDRVALHFKHFDTEHVYPKCKSKRASYEWYIPKGIVKRQWMKKHLELVPSLVVIFFDLDWDEVMWKEKQIACSSKVETIRNSLTGRTTKVAVVLIQKNAPLPPGDDVVAADRAAALCNACELSSKSLFVLPHSDQLLGYTIRLENAFYELSQSYYHSQARKVKSHKELLNKTNHQLLFVRHQFKIAFYNELKQDSTNSLKHYKQAYINILDVRIHDTNVLEVKTIAGFINYKICLLSFHLGAPLDAIQQFRKHVDFYKSLVCPVAVDFEHSAWMSRQFQIFGDLFDDATKNGLAAIQTQHPGFYYQQAANHAITRKKRALERGKAQIDKPNMNLLDKLKSLDYYGQRPWRQGHQSIEPPDATKEREGMASLLEVEKSEDHSRLIIPLLSSAVAQFKKYRSSRMKRFLMVQMGEEYLYVKDYDKALALLSRVTWEYRNERWWNLLTSVLTQALCSAFMTFRVQDYLSLAFEYIGKVSCCSNDDKTRVHHNINNILSGKPPNPEPNISEEDALKAKEGWLKLVQQDTEQSSNNEVSVQMHNLMTFIELKTCFTKKSFKGDEEVGLAILLQTFAPLPVKFTSLAVSFNHEEYNTNCQSDENFELKCGEQYVKIFHFHTLLKHVNNTLQVMDVKLTMGSSPNIILNLSWINGASLFLLPLDNSPFGAPLPTNWDNVNFESTPCMNVCSLKRREAKVEFKIDHQTPCLVNEFYPLDVSIISNESEAMCDVKLSAVVKEVQEGSNLVTNISIGKAEFSESNVIRRVSQDVGTIDMNNKKTVRVFIKCLQKGKRNVTLKLAYSVKANQVHGSNEGKCLHDCHLEKVIDIDVHDAIKTEFTLMDINMRNINEIESNEDFLILINVENIASFPICLVKANLNLRENFEILEDSNQENTQLIHKGKASFLFLISAPKQPFLNSNLDSGEIVVLWRRASTDDVPLVTNTKSLPPIKVIKSPILIDMKTEDLGYEYVPLPITYEIQNRTESIIQVNMNIRPSEGFIFTGPKQKLVRILARGAFSFQLICIPLYSGNLLSPQLQVELPSSKFTSTSHHLVSILPKALHENSVSE